MWGDRAGVPLMLAVVACILPLLVVGMVRILIAPRAPESNEPPVFPLPPRENRAYALGCFLIVALVGAPLWFVQTRLFAAAGADPSALFSHRMSDLPILAVIPAFLVGLVISPSILHRVVRARPDWPALAWMARPLRLEARQMGPLAWIWGILATLVNVAAFETFLVIGPTEFKYSDAFSFSAHRYPTADVAELRVWSQRRAMIGDKVEDARNLEIRLKSRTRIDTNFLIERPDIPLVLAAFQRTTGFKGRIKYVDGPR